MNADTYRDAFLRFVAEGMTNAEALRQFDMKLWNDAMLSEQTWINPQTFEIEAHDGLPPLLTLAAKAGWEERNALDMEQAYDLWQAGWTSELADCFKHNSKSFWRQCPVMSWHWRAPSKRAAQPGKRYLSTNQAWRAMKRAEAA